MAYIKISDPSIVDIAAWNQVINVVNQHSDSLNSLTNNFGASGGASVTWNAEDTNHVFDQGSQHIIYGRSKSTSADVPSANQYWKYVTFTSGSFSSTPMVMATAFSGSNGSGAVAPSTSNSDVVVSVYNVSSSGFAYRLYRTGATAGAAITGTVYVNWVALGPK